MIEGILGCIEHHPRPRPTHHLADLLTLFGGIAMNGTSLASLFLLTKLTMVKSLIGIVGQQQVFL